MGFFLGIIQRTLERMFRLENAMTEGTSAFVRKVCADCQGSGELRIDSENINENFEVEKQTVITECPTCRGLGFLPEEMGR